MISLMRSIFGTYSPYITELSTGDVIYFPDYEYILGVCGFFLVLYCTFRIFGMIFGGKK